MKLANAAARGDILSGAVLVVIGAAGLLGVVDAQVQEVAGFSSHARLYPKILAALLAVIGAGILAGGVAKRGKVPAVEVDWTGMGRVVGVLAGGCAFALLAPLAGFTAATVLATGAFAVICGVYRPLPLALVSLGTALAIRVVAVELLGLTLPGLGSV
ncbi:tripartite tricarboxylate transporter TctB family protein [Acuticoccus sediminis]|uniref:tripartite tricarboxylate transporter TctB family protein n=1 Tax=Acuticoccus sediminis TaxID=2184697 RepID=UPI001CFC4D4D|nr:tripartite tricarboxylate transporter TctB family protein [Acuticoccus sediminis]